MLTEPTSAQRQAFDLIGAPIVGWPCWPAWPGRLCPTSTSQPNLWLGWSPFPAAVDRFHSRIQHEEPRRAHIELLAAASFGTAALVALRRPRGARLSR